MILGKNYLLVEWIDGWMDVNSEHGKSSLAGDLVLRDLLALYFIGLEVGESPFWGGPHEGHSQPSEKLLDGLCQWPRFCAALYLGIYVATE